MIDDDPISEWSLRTSAATLEEHAKGIWALWEDSARQGLLDQSQAVLDNLSPTETGLWVPTELREPRHGIQGGSSWSPAEQMDLARQLVYQEAAMKNAGQVEAAEKAHTCVLRLVETVMGYGVVRAVDGLLHPLAAVWWRPGESLPESYYQWPRDGGSYGDNAYDMRVAVRQEFEAWRIPMAYYLERGSLTGVRSLIAEVLVR